MNATSTVTVDVMDYTTGDRVGSMEMSEAGWAKYAACEHRAYQWPQGIAEASDVLSDEQIEEMGIKASTVSRSRLSTK